MSDELKVWKVTSKIEVIEADRSIGSMVMSNGRDLLNVVTEEPTYKYLWSNGELNALIEATDRDDAADKAIALFDTWVASNSRTATGDATEQNGE